jgi:hypothetical protein
MNPFFRYPYFKRAPIIQVLPATRAAPVSFSAVYIFREPEKSKKW